MSEREAFILGFDTAKEMIAMAHEEGSRQIKCLRIETPVQEEEVAFLDRLGKSWAVFCRSLQAPEHP